MSSQRIKCGDAGMSLMELLVVLLLLSILASTAVTNLAQMKNPLKDGVSQALGFVKEVRAKALSTTSAYTLSPGTATQLVTKKASTCAGPFTATGGLSIELPEGVTLSATNWSVCFNSRGLAEGAQSFTMENSKGDTETIEIFLGGAVRIKP